jgi:hypothetical protein
MSCHLIVKFNKSFDMKLRSILAVAALALLISCGEPYRATDTMVVLGPRVAHTHFSTSYPYATNVVWMKYDPAYTVPIDWEMTGWTVLDENDYLVRFDQDNNNYYAWYDENGEWIGTAYVVTDFNSLPLAVSTAVSKQYPGYTITSVSREFQTDRIAYEIELKNNDTKVKALVDTYGNIIKVKTRSLN